MSFFNYISYVDSFKISNNYFQCKIDVVLFSSGKKKRSTQNPDLLGAAHKRRQIFCQISLPLSTV